MLQYRPEAHVPALNALLSVIDDDDRRFREALGVTLDLVEPKMAERAAKRMLETLLRVPSVNSRIATQLHASPSRPAEVLSSSQDTSACGPESACLDLLPEAGALTQLQIDYEIAQRDLYCADMIDDTDRRRIETSRAQACVDDLADRIATLLVRRS